MVSGVNQAQLEQEEENILRRVEDVGGFAHDTLRSQESRWKDLGGQGVVQDRVS